MPKLTATECRKFIDAMVQKARAMGAPVSGAVLGPKGHIIAVERMDDAGFMRPETAIAKAFTMAAFRSMSPRVRDGLVIQQWFKEPNPRLLVALAALTNGRSAASGDAAPVFKATKWSEPTESVAGRRSRTKRWRCTRAQVGWAHQPQNGTTDAMVRAHANEPYAQAGITDRKRWSPGASDE